MVFMGVCSNTNVLAGEGGWVAVARPRLSKNAVNEGTSGQSRGYSGKKWCQMSLRMPWFLLNSPRNPQNFHSAIEMHRISA